MSDTAPRWIACMPGVLLLLLAGSTASTLARADQTSTSTPMPSVQEVTVTGTLIPEPDQAAAPALTVITERDLQLKGFADVTDALQQSSFSTGSVQGPQLSYGFTQGARTLSLFGLQPNYVKYLVDGLPFADYPALYNGTDTFTSIGGIPTALVDRIDILPGGQSSLYGSDAIAGVVNIILKRKLAGLEASARYGFTKDGGGVEKLFALADSFEVGRATLLLGAQYDRTLPIWGYQRRYTDQFFSQGTTPQTAERDWRVLGFFGPAGDGTNAYYFEDPARCANVARLFGGSVALQTRENFGQYCGTTRSGFYTINNGDHSAQGYMRGTFHLAEQSELYADLLLSNDVALYSNGAGIYDSSFVTNSPYDNYYDPRLGDFVNLHHVFAPEEVGSLSSTLSDSTTNLYRGTAGVRGRLGATWRYDLSATYNSQRLTEHQFTQLTNATLDFYAPLFGPNLGPDPFGFGSSTFEPDYPAFYRPLTPQQLAAMDGFYVNHSRTGNTLFRAQLTGSGLVHLPAGNVDASFVLEGGRQNWDYVPDPGFASNAFFGFTSSGASFGSRTRAAATSEIRIPVFHSLTADISARYDDYKVEDSHVHKPTAMLGLDYEAAAWLQVRGRVGTAFKTPTLSDEFQGKSGYYVQATDYWQCALHGYSGSALATCPYPANLLFGQTEGNPRLQPVNATVWSTGIELTPKEGLTLDADYLHWTIDNEVGTQSSDQILRTEGACRLGQLNITSPTCQQALALVTRDPVTQQLVSVLTPKVNISRESLDVFTLSASYRWHTRDFGLFSLDGAWTDEVRHHFQQFPGDPTIDLLTDPYYSTEFKSKTNASISWDRKEWGATLYANRVGRSPNYLAALYPEGYATPGAGTLQPWTLVNLNLRYRLSAALELSATITNVFNKMPPIDRSYPGTFNQPFNTQNYNNYGSAYRIEVHYRASGQ